MDNMTTSKKFDRTSLSIKYNEKGQNEYNLEDLKMMKNLRVLTLSGYSFDDNYIEIINSLPNLDFIHFDFCNFHLEKSQINLKATTIVFDTCKILDIKTLNCTNAKSIKIIGSEIDMCTINIEDFCNMSKLTELSLNNYRIENIESVVKFAPNLISLNLDGSIVERIDLLESLNVKVSNNDKYLIEIL